MGIKDSSQGEKMKEDISVQILTQTSDNIIKLFELTTRIDERVKSIQNKQGEFAEGLKHIIDSHNEVLQTIAVIESKNSHEIVTDLSRKLNSIETRLSAKENTSKRFQSKLRTGFDFIVKLAWIVLAAWICYKLGIEMP